MEIAVARRSKEGIDDLSLAGEIGIGGSGCAKHPVPRAARELPCRSGKAANDRSDFIEGHAKHIVQHEGQPLRRSQLFEHNEERQTDRLGEGRFLLRLDAILIDNRLGHVGVQRFLPA
jgi:hypothetical protein